MTLITFMSDYGHTDHYVAAVKAKILQVAPQASILDISHSIGKFNVVHAANVLKFAYRDFPTGTIHLVTINSAEHQPDNLIAARFDNHFFIGMDNGLLSLVTESEPEAYLLSDEADHIFPGKSVLAPAAAKLSLGSAISELGNPSGPLKQFLSLQLRISPNQIMGHVIHIDHYGNLITNITAEAFEEVSKNRPYRISVRREWVDNVSKSYSRAENGDLVAIFNSNNLLEIAISQGNAAELLGMEYNTPVIINFS